MPVTKEAKRAILSWGMLAVACVTVIAWAGLPADALPATMLLVVVLLLLYLDPRGRRRRRMVRGHCPRCDYDLRDRQSAGCPECGWRRSEPA